MVNLRDFILYSRLGVVQKQTSKMEKTKTVVF